MNNKRRKLDSSYGYTNLQDIILASHTNSISNLDQQKSTSNCEIHDVQPIGKDVFNNDDYYDESIIMYDNVDKSPLQLHKFMENFA